MIEQEFSVNKLTRMIVTFEENIEEKLGLKFSQIQILESLKKVLNFVSCWQQEPCSCKGNRR